MVRITVPALGWRPFPDRKLGWSTKEYRRFKPGSDKEHPSGGRILFLGDSFLAGSGISNLRQRFPMVYRDRFAPDSSVRIFASGGWGTDQQLLAFVQKGKVWKPDIALVAFCSVNDISNILSDRHIHHWKPYFTLDASKNLQLFDVQGNPARLSEASQDAEAFPFQSFLVDLIRHVKHQWFFRKERRLTRPNVDLRYQKFLQGNRDTQRIKEILGKRKRLSWSPERGVNRVSAFIREAFPTNTYQWNLLEKILETFKEEADAIQARLVVMVLPTPLAAESLQFVPGSDFEFLFQTPDGSFTFRSSEPNARLQKITSRIGIDLFDPTHDFIEIVRQRGWLRSVWPAPTENHFSEEGHRILADLLHGYLSGNPERSPPGPGSTRQ